jgi:S1-C subfamily serine protease
VKAGLQVLPALALALCLWTGARAGLVEVIEVTKPSVVAVGLYDPTGSPRFGFRGTGFAVNGGNDLVTNLHVLPQVPGDRPGVRLAVLVRRPGAEPELRDAAVVRSDDEHDLVLLRIQGPPLPPLPLADPEAVHEGTSIAVIGYPIGGALGFTPVTHRGIVSSITAIALPMPSSRQLNERTVARLRKGSFDVYQLDATAYPGNSGGPVVDADTGKVVGVINMVLVKGTRESALTNPTGISYAIPARFVADLLRER